MRLENWLTVEEARTLWQLPNAHTLKGKRDRAILAVLLGCGLRRGEWIDLTCEHIQRREDHWAIVDLIGKAGIYAQSQFLIGLNRLWTLGLVRLKSETENCFDVSVGKDPFGGTLGFVTIRAVNWNGFNFYLDMSPCRPQKNTWDASNDFARS